jgi:CheY-like chemotaxis protein
MSENRRKILCIEDDRETAALIAEELAERGFDVRLAHDGREGFAAILKTMPDLVLSDISMPVMSGFELLERLTALAPRFRNSRNARSIFTSTMPAPSSAPQPASRPRSRPRPGI